MPILHWSESEIREVGRWVTDWIAHHYATLAERRITPEVRPDEVDRLFDEPLPEAPSSAAAVLAEFARRVPPHSFTLTHPGYFGLMNPTPVPIAVFAEALTAALNQNGGAWHHAPAGTAVEKRVIRWLADLAGLPPESFGVIVNGGSLANLMGLRAALASKFPQAGTLGLARCGAVPTVYASEEAHFSNLKNVDLMGLGREQLRLLPADERYRMRVDALARQIQDDRRAGLHPLCVIATAGTTSSGAVDPLGEIADLCAAEGVWLHVDAAFGGGALLSRTHRTVLAGIERADSVTIDPHKWMCIPFEAGVVLVRDRSLLRRAFDTPASYLPRPGLGSAEAVEFRKYGVQGSRAFLGLKVWMGFKELGRETYERLVDEHVRLARAFADRIAGTPEFEVAAPPDLPIVCFRHRPRDIEDDARLDRHQLRFRERLIADGRFWVSNAYLRGRAWIRWHAISYLTDDDVVNAFYRRCVETAHPGAHAPAP